MTPKEDAVEPETESASEAETRALYAQADDLIREARLKLVARVDDIQRLAHADPRAYTSQDRLTVRLSLLTMTALIRTGRLTDAIIYPERCVHGLRYAAPDDTPDEP
jgi:hypothetical protein